MKIYLTKKFNQMILKLQSLHTPKTKRKKNKRNLGENVCACDTTNWMCSKCKQYTCDLCCAIGENGDTTAEEGSRRICMECGVSPVKHSRKPTNYKDHIMW